MVCLLKGATALPMAAFDAARLLARSSAERVTALPGPPTLFSSLLDLAETGARRPVVAAHRRSSAPSSVPAELFRRMRAELPFEPVTTGYGLTEATAMCSITRADDDPEHVADWNGGTPIDDIEIKVVDDAATTRPLGAPGELLVRGYNVMRGYYDDPDATADGDRARRLAAHRRHRGRQRARRLPDHRPEEGHLHLRRLQRVTRRGRGPARRRSTPSPRSRWSACPTTASARSASRSSSPAPASTSNPKQVIAWAREHMANYKVPRRVEIVDALPLNASGQGAEDRAARAPRRPRPRRGGDVTATGPDDREVDAARLSRLLGVAVTDVEVLDETAGSANRMRLRLTYAEATSALPEVMFLKRNLADFSFPAEMYSTEVRIYRDVLPGLGIEQPAVYAIEAADDDVAFTILMEDLGTRPGARVGYVLDPTTARRGRQPAGHAVPAAHRLVGRRPAHRRAPVGDTGHDQPADAVLGADRAAPGSPPPRAGPPGPARRRRPLAGGRLVDGVRPADRSQRLDGAHVAARRRARQQRVLRRRRSGRAARLAALPAGLLGARCGVPPHLRARRRRSSGQRARAARGLPRAPRGWRCIACRPPTRPGSSTASTRSTAC